MLLGSYPGAAPGAIPGIVFCSQGEASIFTFFSFLPGQVGLLEPFLPRVFLSGLYPSAFLLGKKFPWPGDRSPRLFANKYLYNNKEEMKYIKPYRLYEAEEIGWQEWCSIPGVGRFLAKLDTGNGTKASSLGVDSMEIDGDLVYWSCNGKDRVDPIKDWSHAEVGSSIDKRPIIILDIELGPHQLSEVPIALTDRSSKSTPVLINRDLLSRLGVVVAPDQAFLLGESEEEISGLKRMVELGLIDYSEFKRRLKELGVDDPTRAKFIELLRGVFAEAGVEWRDLATDRQKRNFTSVLNLTPAEVAKIIFSGRWVEGLSPRQVTRRDKLVAFLETVRPQMERITGHEDPRMGFWFWIFQGSARPSGWIATPSSSDLFKFDGTITPEGALARFIYQLILDASYRRWE